MKMEAAQAKEASTYYSVMAEAHDVSLGYKWTEVGVIPQDWTIAGLGRICSMKSGVGITSTSIDEFSKYPCFGGNGVRGFTDRFTHSGRFALIGRQGALCGNVVCAEGEFFASEHAIVVTAYTRTDIGWLFYVLDRMRLNEYSESSAQPGLSVSKILLLPVARPPPPEQRAIAEALSDVDGLLRALEALIAKKKAIKQAAMQQLLTGKTRLPGFSGEWETTQLGQYVTFLRTGTHARAKLTGEGSLKYLHYGDIHTTTRVRLDPRTDSMPSLPYECARTLDRLRDGDLVFVDASEDLDGVGKSVEITGTSDIEVVSGLHTIAARFEKSFLEHGFKAYLQFYPAFRNHLRRLAAGTKVYATNRTHISSAEIRLPGNREQTAIATVLSDLDAEISALERRHDKIRSVKLGMMQQLLTGRSRLVKPGSLQNNEETDDHVR